MNLPSCPLSSCAFFTGLFVLQLAFGVACGADAGRLLDDNPFHQQAKLAADDAVTCDHLAWSSAMSADGNTIAVGARDADVGVKLDQGAVYVFVREGSSWFQQAKLIAADGNPLEYLGYAVALSGDGSTLAAGAPDAGTLGEGSVYIFTRSGSTWQQEEKLTAADGAANDRLGESVSLSGDGNTLLAGASGADISGKADQGAAYAFTRTSAGWTQHSKLKAVDGAADDAFGSSLSLSQDGKTVVAGAYCATVDGYPACGAAYVFTRSRYSWPQQAKLTPADVYANLFFGASVAVSGDGNAVVVGAPDAGTSGQGAVYVFQRAASVWSQQVKLTAADVSKGEAMGGCVALSGDGNTLAAGATYADIGGHNSQGAVYVFTRYAAVWAQRAKLTPADGAAYDYFGHSVALSGDGSTVVGGSHDADVGGHVSCGAAWVFAASTLQFQSAVYSVPENAGFVTLTITRSNGTGGHVGASYTTVAGSALAGRDFTASYGELDWPDGDDSPRSIVIRIFNRLGAQASRSFNVMLYDSVDTLLGVPSNAEVIIGDVPPGPTIRANGATGSVSVVHPGLVTVDAAFNADIYAGTPVDWWCVAYAHGGNWYYLNSALIWTSFNGDLAACHPAYQGHLFNLPPTPVLFQYALPLGIYDFWFGVDYPMDGLLDLGGQAAYDQVTVAVQ